MKSVSLKGSIVLTSGKFAGRKSDSPLISITGCGEILLNSAFMVKNETHEFCSFIQKGKDVYLVMSSQRRKGFCKLFYTGKSANTAFRNSTVSRLYGAPGSAVRFNPIKVNLNLPGVVGYFLEKVSEDKFSSNEIAFEKL